MGFYLTLTIRHKLTHSYAKVTHVARYENASVNVGQVNIRSIMLHYSAGLLRQAD